MQFHDLFNLVHEQDGFSLQAPEADKWYRTHDPFHPEANYKEPSEFESIDSWTDYIEEDDVIDTDRLPELIEQFHLKANYYFDNFYLNLKDNLKSFWFEFNKSNDSYEVTERSDNGMLESIDQMDDHTKLGLLKINEGDLYIGAWECTIKELQEHPGTVYHYTTEEKWNDIQVSGGMKTSYGTGMTNRSTQGIFTSVDADEHASGTYGDVCLAIELNRFKQRSGIERLDLAPEPDVLEATINETFAHALGFNGHESYVTSDMSPFTVIVGHIIPVRYITRLN